MYIHIYTYIYFLSQFLFMWHSQFTGQQGKGGGAFLIPLYHFHLLHECLHISQAITAESSPLHITCGQTQAGNL